MLTQKKLDSWYTPKKPMDENEEEEVCEYCNGTGEVTVPDFVYQNEPYMAEVGTRPCICRDLGEDEYNEDTDLSYFED